MLLLFPRLTLLEALFPPIWLPSQGGILLLPCGMSHYHLLNTKTLFFLHSTLKTENNRMGGFCEPVPFRAILRLRGFSRSHNSSANLLKNIRTHPWKLRGFPAFLFHNVGDVMTRPTEWRKQWKKSSLSDSAGSSPFSTTSSSPPSPSCWPTRLASKFLLCFLPFSLCAMSP